MQGKPWGGRQVIRTLGCGLLAFVSALIAFLCRLVSASLIPRCGRTHAGSVSRCAKSGKTVCVGCDCQCMQWVAIRTNSGQCNKRRDPGSPSCTRPLRGVNLCAARGAPSFFLTALTARPATCACSASYVAFESAARRTRTLTSSMRSRLGSRMQNWSGTRKCEQPTSLLMPCTMHAWRSSRRPQRSS